MSLKKALKLDPDNKMFLEEMVQLGYDMANSKIELFGLSRLYDSGQMEDEYLPPFLDLLAMNGKYRQALEVSQILISRLAAMKIANKRKGYSQESRDTTISSKK